MTQDEIIEMAEQAGVAFSSDDYPDIWGVHMHVGKQEIEAFAKLVAAKEREECADFLEHGVIDDEGHNLHYAKEIRARGEQA
jgi:hypothetical protein